MDYPSSVKVPMIEAWLSPPSQQAAIQTKKRFAALLARREELLLNDYIKDLLQKERETRLTMYDYYPYLFCDAFPTISSDALNDLSVAAKLLGFALIHADRIMDADCTPEETASALVYVLTLQEEAYTLLRQLFPACSLFWKHFRSYLSHHFRACLFEKKFASGELPWKAFDEKIALDIAIGKNGVNRAVIAGLAALSGSEEWLEILTKSIDLYNFAGQMVDDLCDWKADYLQRFPSLLLCDCLAERPAQPKAEDMEEIARRLYYDGYAPKVLQMAVDALEQALLLTTNLAELPWRANIYHFLLYCEDLLRDIVYITQENRRRAAHLLNFHLKLPPARTMYEELAGLALRPLVRQWSKGFAEVRHRVPLNAFIGSAGKDVYLRGDVLQRAIIASTLWEVAQTFHVNLQSIIDDELAYLLGKSCKDVTKGWSYFPDLPDMPPDSDILAYMLQLLFRTQRRKEIATFCEPALVTLLKERHYEDGSLGTLIVPLAPSTPFQEGFLRFVANSGMAEPDVAVIANLLYALYLYDFSRFEPVITSGISYLEAQQQPDGSWLSRRYCGFSYSTFACVRLLVRARATSSALDRARQFLRASQCPDGSWLSSTGDSDVLATALALLSWSELLSLEKSQQRMAEPPTKAFAYLRASYSEQEQSWPSCDYLCIPINAGNNQGKREAVYASRTMTNTFVLQAAIAWNDLQDRLFSRS